MGSYAVNSVAAGKVVLHAAKFAHAEVCGVLLGRASEDRDAPVVVEDAIPFFHKSENKNSPIMEVALAQVSGEDLGEVARCARASEGARSRPSLRLAISRPRRPF